MCSKAQRPGKSNQDPSASSTEQAKEGYIIHVIYNSPTPHLLHTHHCPQPRHFHVSVRKRHTHTLSLSPPARVCLSPSQYSHTPSSCSRSQPKHDEVITRYISPLDTYLGTHINITSLFARLGGFKKLPTLQARNTVRCKTYT